MNDKPEVTQSVLANFLGLTSRQVRNLTPRILRSSGKQGTSLLYPLKDSIQAFLAYKEEALQRLSCPVDLESARARKENALAQLAELDLEERLGHMVKVEDVKKQTEEAFTRVRAKLLSLPGRLASQMVGLKSAPQAQALIEAGIHEALAELAGGGLGDEP